MNKIDFFKALAAPFDKIHWRAQSVVDKGTGPVAMGLAYMDARDVMDRLDSLCGPDGWQDTYSETQSGRVICTLTIRVGNEWIGKSDGAGDTAVEGEKGGISDAFKRAAVKWGIGRYLYALETPWADCEAWKGQDGKPRFKKWTPSGLAKLNKVHSAYGVANDAPKEKPAFPQGIATGISQLREMARNLWREIESCKDDAQLNALITTGDAAKIIAQAQNLTGSYAEIWSGNGGDNPGLKGLIDRKNIEFSNSADNDVRHAMEGKA